MEMKSTGAEYPSWRQHVGVEKLIPQIAVFTVTFILGSACFFVSFLWGGQGLANRFVPLFFAFLFWMFSMDLVVTSDMRSAREFNGLREQVGADGEVRVSFRIGRFVSILPFLLLIFLMSSGIIGLVGAALDEGFLRYGVFILLTSPILGVVIAFCARAIISVPVVTVILSPSGVTWRLKAGWRRLVYQEFSIDWSSVSRLWVEYRPDSNSIFRGCVVLIDSPGLLDRKGDHRFLRRAMVTIVGGSVVEFKLPLFPVNFNVAFSLMNAFMDSNRKGEPVTEEMIREIVRVPPLKIQRSLSRRQAGFGK